jgi:hypothetical protein
MSVIIITLNIDTESGDDSVAFCTLLEMLNQVKERIRTSNYSLDKYSTQTFDLMNGDDRAMVSIIGPQSKPSEARKRATALAHDISKHNGWGL